MRAVDTNLLVRLLVRDAPEQVKQAEAFVGSGAWGSHLVLEIARKAGHLPLGTFDRTLAKITGAERVDGR